MRSLRRSKARSSRMPEFSTSIPPATPGTHFACDVLCRARQKILVTREVFSSYTIARLIVNEQKDLIRNAILESTAEIKSHNGARIRVDGATAMQSLVNDETLSRNGLHLEVGRLKNVNKNPVAEKAIQELERELKRICPEGGPINGTILALAVVTLIKRIRNRGLSAYEILTQRDNVIGDHLRLNDAHLAHQQHDLRLRNHYPSALSKVPKGKPAQHLNTALGELVYIKQEGSKHTARDRYIITAVSESFLTVQKLSGSRFGKKQYQVKPSEVFRVPSMVNERAPIAHSADPFESDNSSNTDTDFVTAPRSRHSTDTDSSDLDSEPANDPPLAPLLPPLDNPPNVDLAGDQHNQNRPQRNRAPPMWIQSGDWDTE